MLHFLVFSFTFSSTFLSTFSSTFSSTFYLLLYTLSHQLSRQLFPIYFLVQFCCRFVVQFCRLVFALRRSRRVTVPPLQRFNAVIGSSGPQNPWKIVSLCQGHSQLLRAAKLSHSARVSNMQRIYYDAQLTNGFARAENTNKQQL